MSKSLVHLNVASNEISNEGMVILAKALLYNESLTSLNVSTIEGTQRNRISVKGVKML